MQSTLPLLTNLHVVDHSNIGDLLSAPLKYFQFPGYQCEIQDLRTIDSHDVSNTHVIVGGGGLLYKRFLPQIETVNAKVDKRKLIFWGVGQQHYVSNRSALKPFDYKPYTSQGHLVGVRDDHMSHDWVPCVSCMHSAFDKLRKPQHELVVFSHKKFQIDMPGIPRMTNASSSFEEVLDFLGSGETILTSSFHGAYWGTLLGRKVLAFPFSSKFFTLRHPITIYPIDRWTQIKWQLKVFGKVLYTVKHEQGKLTCGSANWRQYLKNTVAYPDSLQECRERNHWFYQQALQILDD